MEILLITIAVAVVALLALPVIRARQPNELALQPIRIDDNKRATRRRR